MYKITLCWYTFILRFVRVTRRGRLYTLFKQSDFSGSINNTSRTRSSTKHSLFFSILLLGNDHVMTQRPSDETMTSLTTSKLHTDKRKREITRKKIFWLLFFVVYRNKTWHCFIFNFRNAFKQHISYYN